MLCSAQRDLPNHISFIIDTPPILTIHPVQIILILLSRQLLCQFSPLCLALALLLAKICPVQRTRTAQTQPWPYTFEVEEMRRMAGQADDERVRVIKEGIITNRTGLRRSEGFSRDAIEI